LLLCSPYAAGDTQNEENKPEKTDFAKEQNDAFAGANLQVITREQGKELIEKYMEQLISHTSKSNLEFVVSALSDCIPDNQKDYFKVTPLLKKIYTLICLEVQ
jgi:hypothetical protein